MPLSLKCQIDKLEHKGQITKEEHQALLKKLDGHDKQIRADAIENMYVSIMMSLENIRNGADVTKEFEWIHQFDEQLKEQKNE